VRFLPHRLPHRPSRISAIRRAAPVLGVALLAATFSSGGASSASPAPSASVTALSVPGHYAAGTARVTLANGDAVQLWYPVDKSAVQGKPTYTYNLKSWVPASLANNPLLSSLPSAEPTTGYLDAPIAHDTAASGDPGHGFPVVLFAHGYGSYPEQSSFLTDHLATWGFVVAAPDEQATDLAAVLGGTHTPGALTAGQALNDTLAYLHTADHTSGNRLDGRLDLGRIGVVGHSLGGGAAITLARNPQVKTYAALAPAPGTPPTTHKPGLVMYGSSDLHPPPHPQTADRHPHRRPQRLRRHLHHPHRHLQPGGAPPGPQGIVRRPGDPLHPGHRRLLRPGCRPDGRLPPDRPGGDRPDARRAGHRPPRLGVRHRDRDRLPGGQCHLLLHHLNALPPPERASGGGVSHPLRTVRGHGDDPMRTRNDLRHFERPPFRPRPGRAAGWSAAVALTAWVGSTGAGAHLPVGMSPVLVAAAALAGGTVARYSNRPPGRAWRRPVGSRPSRRPDRRWT
jgi:dienelactone hydrolase